MNIFKTHYSVGKSVLTFDEDGENSVFTIAKGLGQKEIFVLEDSISGLMEAYENSQKTGIALRYGLLLNHCEDKDNVSKFGAFAKNTEGYKSLVQLSSKQEKNKLRSLSSAEIKELWNDNLWMVIPFYDSFLFKNLLELKACIFDLAFKPTMLWEDNDLPFDGLLKKKVFELAEKEGLGTLKVQTCLYPNEDWFDAWQTLKAMNSRGYKGADLGRPNLDHCGSTNFWAR